MKVNPMETQKQFITLNSPKTMQECISILIVLLREVRTAKDLLPEAKSLAFGTITPNGVDVFCAGVLQGHFEGLPVIPHSGALLTLKYEKEKFSSEVQQDALQMVKHYILHQEAGDKNASDIFTDYLCTALNQIKRFAKLNQKT